MTKTLKPKITVITPSNRGSEALEIVARSLNRQTFTDFEWLVGSPKDYKLLHEHIHVGDPSKEEGDYWVFNKLHNKLIKEAKGELIVSIQDWTSFQPDALEKFWFHFENDPKSIVSGVGNKFSDDSMLVQTWKDPRQRDDNGTFYEVYFNDIEGNFCSVPREAILAVGGFDEYLDKFAGMDWYSVLARIHILGGYHFFIDQTNISKSMVHGRYEAWEERNAIHGPYQERAQSYKENPVLDYLHGE